MNIIIVEDEKEIADGICTILKKEGYSASVEYNGISGLDEILSGVYDLVILDIMLPGMSGLEVLKNIRREKSAISVILLTALSQSEDIITGLDSGADDYLTKPFDAGELLARIRARLRDTGELEAGTLTFSDIRLEQLSQKLYGPEKSVKLAKKEYLLLEYLMLNNERILQRDSIITRVWGYDENTEYNQLDVYVSFVRKKLRFVGSDVVIETAKGVGYSLKRG